MAKDLVRTRRYVQKFYQMRTQLQAVGLRIQTLRSNQQMTDAMRGATRVSVLRVSSPELLLIQISYPSRTPPPPPPPERSPKKGDEEHEPRAQPPANPAHHERV
jgi:hypothetical protein